MCLTHLLYNPCTGAHHACTRAKTGFSFLSFSFLHGLASFQSALLGFKRVRMPDFAYSLKKGFTMNVKTFAHQLQAHLKASAALDLKRTHTYELIAAALGDKSYAALKARGLLCPLPSKALRERYAQFHPVTAEKRAQSLGFPSDQAVYVGSQLCARLQSENLGVVPLDDVLNHLLFGHSELFIEKPQEDADAWDWDDDEDLYSDSEDEEGLSFHSPWVVQGLQAAAEGNDGRAHLALTLLINLERDEDGEDDGDPIPDSRSGLYWYERQQRGEVLAGVEKEWADGYAALVQNRNHRNADRTWRDTTSKKHLQKAADLGQHDALLLLADRYGEDRFFDLKEPNVRADPLWIADIADRVGRYEWVPAWTTLAAEQGSISAMRLLVQNAHRNDPLKAWTWFYLAKLHGTDLTRDNYRAIHENGS